MTGPEEHALYLSDRRAWAEYVAPNWVAIVTGATGAAAWAIAGDELQAVLTHYFAARLAESQPEAKRALWSSLPEDLQESLRQLKAREAA